jgi:hypothetical protein
MSIFSKSFKKHAGAASLEGNFIEKWENCSQFAVS